MCLPQPAESIHPFVSQHLGLGVPLMLCGTVTNTRTTLDQLNCALLPSVYNRWLIDLYVPGEYKPYQKMRLQIALCMVTGINYRVCTSLPARCFITRDTDTIRDNSSFACDVC